MFAFDRSAMAVLIPLALLLAVVIWSNQPHAPAAARQAQAAHGERAGAGGDRPGQTVATVPRSQTISAVPRS